MFGALVVVLVLSAVLLPGAWFCPGPVRHVIEAHHLDALHVFSCTATSYSGPRGEGTWVVVLYGGKLVNPVHGACLTSVETNCYVYEYSAIINPAGGEMPTPGPRTRSVLSQFVPCVERRQQSSTIQRYALGQLDLYPPPNQSARFVDRQLSSFRQWPDGLGPAGHILNVENPGDGSVRIRVPPSQELLFACALERYGLRAEVVPADVG